MKNPISNPKMWSLIVGVTWYAIFGFLHELSHIVAASMIRFDTIDWKSINWINLVLTRRFQIMNYGCENFDKDEIDFFIIRQTGWIASVAIAFLVHFIYIRFRYKESTPFVDSLRLTSCDYDGGGKLSSFNLKWCHLAAYMTAFDALWTDLLQIKPVFLLFDHNDNASKATFFCGNFGIILLHSAWLDDNGGKSALDILTKMIEVTMMRGAQSGGIVTFKNGGRMNDVDGNYNIQMKSIRSRVVKSKRADL